MTQTTWRASAIFRQLTIFITFNALVTFKSVYMDQFSRPDTIVVISKTAFWDLGRKEMLFKITP